MVCICKVQSCGSAPSGHPSAAIPPLKLFNNEAPLNKILKAQTKLEWQHAIKLMTLIAIKLPDRVLVILIS